MNTCIAESIDLRNSKIYNKLNKAQQKEYLSILKKTDQKTREELIDFLYKYKITVDSKDQKIDKLRVSLCNERYYKLNELGEIKSFFPKVLTSQILNELDIINIDGDCSNNLVYHNGTYRKEFKLPDDKRLNMLVYNKLANKDPGVTSNLKNTLKCIMEEKRVSPDKVNANKKYINFRNGILNTESWEIEEHSPSIINTVQIKANYKKNESSIEGTELQRYLRSSLDDDIIEVIQEIIGYIISNNTELQKFFILKGKGSNGKSVLIQLINALFDEESISSVELKDLSKPEFAANLFDKKVNTCGDISTEYLTNTGLLKQLTGEDIITAKQLYSNPFSFKNKAKMLFSCNEMPGTNDKTYAFIRRLIIIPFDKIISEDEKDIHLASKIIKKEFDIFVAWAIEGLKRLKQNNFKLSESKQINNAVKSYELSNNSIKEFVYTYCKVNLLDPTCFIPKVEFTQLYKAWCNQEGRQALGPKHANETLSNIGLSEKSHTYYNGRYWIMVSWNEQISEIIKANNINITINGSKIESEKKYIACEREGKMLNDSMEKIK